MKKIMKIAKIIAPDVFGTLMLCGGIYLLCSLAATLESNIGLYQGLVQMVCSFCVIAAGWYGVLLTDNHIPRGDEE